MPTDFRIEVGFIDHPKTVKLERRMGFNAVKCLLRLWGWAAENRPKGVLYGMSLEDIEIACRWDGEPGTLISTMSSEDCQWLDIIEGVYKLHDWEKHQGYIFHSPERSERARNAVCKRWGKDKNTNSIPVVYGENTKSNTPSPSPSPSPIPSPDPLSSRLEKFKASIQSYSNKYPMDMLFTDGNPDGEQDKRSFFGYWSEYGGKKMAFEKQKTWELPKRLATWARNNSNSDIHSQSLGERPQGECEV